MWTKKKTRNVLITLAVFCFSVQLIGLYQKANKFPSHNIFKATLFSQLILVGDDWVEEVSSLAPIMWGVPQSLVPSHLLFSIYMKLVELIHCHRVKHEYADDAQWCISTHGKLSDALNVYLGVWRL